MIIAASGFLLSIIAFLNLSINSLILLTCVHIDVGDFYSGNVPSLLALESLNKRIVKKLLIALLAHIE
jgi:hypothetical protein